MSVSRRNFIRCGALATASGLVGCATSGGADGTADVRLAYDVVVVGGGPAGVCAAIAAARNGAKTLIVEQGNCLGGMATQGLVGPFMTCYDKSGKTQVVRGLFEEIVAEMVKRGGAIHPRDVRAGTAYTAWIVRGHDHVTPFDSETLKFVLDDKVAEAGVDVLYHATLVRPLMDGRAITGAEALTKGGLRRIGAKVVVDATGDGDVAFRAGAPCVSGDPERNGAMQPCTTFFRVSGMPLELVEKWRAAHPGERLFASEVRKAKEAGEWTIPRPHVNCYLTPRKDEWFVNVSRMNGVDPTDPRQLSDAETLGRRQVREVMNLFRKYVLRDIRLSALATTLGIRESRHVLGDAVVGKDDILGGRVPADSIALCAYAIDLHGGKGASGTLFLTVEKGEYYGIPYRALVPRAVENLLVAGRCISATSVAAASLRVMPPAMATGEAAGTDAALCVRAGTLPRKLDVSNLIATLRSQKVYLG